MPEAEPEVGGKIPWDNKWKTIHFCYDNMKRLIGFGEPVIAGSIFIGFDSQKRPDHFTFSPWIAFVPPCYKEQCAAIAAEVAQRCLGEPVGEALQDRIISEIQERIIAEVEPIP